MSEWISEQWTNIRTEDVYKDWFGGPILGFPMHGSLYNNAPLRPYIYNLL